MNKLRRCIRWADSVARKPVAHVSIWLDTCGPIFKRRDDLIDAHRRNRTATCASTGIRLRKAAVITIDW
jgi:hypothetical protein